jgi:MFS transporter, SP family, general alpha glucoside:H+ symporter
VYRLLLWNFTFDWRYVVQSKTIFCHLLTVSSVGPVAYAIFCEVSATRVRSKTIAVATAVQAIIGIIMTVAIPYLINPAEANLRGKLGFFFGGLSLPCLVWCYYRIPEMKDRTYEELDIMFERKVPTREFGKYKI